MRNRIRRILILALACAAPAPALEPDAVVAWKEDLAAARAALLENHPKPTARIPAEALDGAFDALAARLAELAPHEAVVGLAEVVASLGDGHTRLTLPLPADAGFVVGHSTTPPPADPALGFHTLPIRLGLYAEGLVVERAAAPHRDLAGARVASIGGRSVEEAIAAVTPVVRHDNRSQLLDLLPMHLVVPEILAAKGLAPTREGVEMAFDLADGARVVRRLEALAGEGVEWVSALEGAPRVAPSWAHLAAGRAPVRGAFARGYWMERIGDGGTLFVQYNQSEDEEQGETVLEFARRLGAELGREGVERVVLDLRWNWGGDHSRDRALLHALIARDERLGAGRFFVLIGRGTFSAAMMFAVELEGHLHPVFVGEPSGSSPNHFGDSRKTRLPHSGLTIRVSTLDWRLSHPLDERRAIAPHVAVEPSWSALVAGRDPALEAILAAPATDCAAPGRYSGMLTAPPYEVPLTAVLPAADGEPGSGSLSLAGFAESLPLTGSTGASGGWEAIAAGTPRGDLRLVARCAGRRLVGVGAFARRPDLEYAFVLEPTPEG